MLAGGKGISLGKGTPDRSARERLRVLLIHTRIWRPSGFSIRSILEKVNQQRPLHN